MDFDAIKSKYDWKRIFGCPGRFILKHQNINITIEKLLNEKVIVNSFTPADSKDEVLIVKIKDGSIFIS